MAQITSILDQWKDYIRDAVNSSSRDITFIFKPYIKDGQKKVIVFTPITYSKFVNNGYAPEAQYKNMYSSDSVFVWNGISRDLCDLLINAGYRIQSLTADGKKENSYKLKLMDRNEETHTIIDRVSSPVPEDFFRYGITSFLGIHN